MSSISLVGPQILPEGMVDCAFHYRNDVLDTIENFRLNAALDSEEFAAILRSREQEAIMRSRSYNNTISILGSRGSGKTSIIMTLQKRLSGDLACQDSVPKNIMMPILIPQDIEPEQALLSCVISQLLKKAEEIEREVQEDAREIPNYAWRKWDTQRQGGLAVEPFRACMDRLLNAFDLRFHRGRSFQPPEADQVYYYMDSVKRDAELLGDMLRLISMIVDYYRYQASVMRQGPTMDGIAEPLLFFTIDDLDLAPHRSSEVLDLVLRYLQHPNVVVICGWNHELFQNHLCMDLLRTQGVLEADLLDTNFSFEDVFMSRYRKRTAALDSARRLAVDNLKKAFPPSQRFEIRSLSTQERADFPYSLDHVEENPKVDRKTLFFWVERTIWQCQRIAGAESKEYSFLRDRTGEKLYVYMRIFDNKVRGLANTRRAFESLELYLSKKLEERPVNGENGAQLDITSQIKILFDTLLFANTRFLPYRRGLRDLVQIRKVVLPRNGGEGALEYYCNFRVLKQVLERYWEEKEKKKEIEEGAAFPYDAEHVMEQKYDYFPELVIDVFLLLNFMENFLHTITQTKGSAHGGREFSTYLNEIYKPIDFTIKPQELLAQAIVVGGVQKLKLFPETADFALSVSILNAYERDGFKESQYHFTGFLSLMRLFRMVNRLLSPKKKQNMDEVDGHPSAGEKLDMGEVRKVLRADSAWLATIMRLFNALQPEDENVMRLAVYTNILESAQDEAEAMRQAALQSGSTKKRLQGAAWDVPELTDDDLDLLVQCLRTIDKNRSYFLLCKQRGTLKRGSNKSNAEDQVAYRRAKSYCEFSRYLHSKIDERNPKEDEIIIGGPSHLKNALEMLPGYKSSETERDLFFDPELEKLSEYDIVIKALDKADQDTEMLLHDIKLRMKQALQMNYSKQSTSLEQRYQYLTQAAVAVRKYVEHWELIPGRWGKREIQAGTELVAIFQSNLLEDQVDDMLDILSMGPNLEQTSRDRYANRVGLLRQWTSSHSDYFTEDELEHIRDDFVILSEAPKQIRRGLRIEGEIYNTVQEIGTLVAQEFGAVACELFHEWKQDTGKRLTVWPVSISYDKEMLQLSERLERLIPKKSVSKSTLFDVDYSDVELYLQIAGE